MNVIPYKLDFITKADRYGNIEVNLIMKLQPENTLRKSQIREAIDVSYVYGQSCGMNENRNNITELYGGVGSGSTRQRTKE